MTTPVSGPGPYSQRTDLGQKRFDVPNADYGEQKAYQALQAGAPMASSPDLSGMDFSSMFGNPGDRVTPLNAESAQPGVPVTDGASLGAGAGVEAMQFSNPDEKSRAKLAAWLPALEHLANRPDSSSNARAMVRRIKATV